MIPSEPEGEQHCCSPDNAWSWVNCVAELALGGDLDALKTIGQAVQHYLDALRGATTPARPSEERQS